MSPLTVVAKIVAKSESVEGVHRELLKILEPSRAEEGCISYNLFQDTENAAIFVMVENWKSADHLAEHMKTPHFNALVAAIGGITDTITINKLAQLD